MPKVLGTAGGSLAETYDIEGSLVKVEELLSRDVSLVDGMGERVFSERLQSFVVALNSGAIAQSTTFDVTSAFDVTPGANRLTACSIYTDTIARLTNVQLCMQDSGTGGEVTVCTWDTTNDVEVVSRIVMPGGAVGARNLCRPTGVAFYPHIVLPTGRDGLRPNFIMRGISSAFGAGTVTIIGIIQVARANPQTPQAGHPSAAGLPVPSW